MATLDLSELPDLLTVRDLAERDLPHPPTALGYRRPTRGVLVADWVDRADPWLRIRTAEALRVHDATLGGWAAGFLLERHARPGGDDLTVFDGHAGRGTVLPVLMLAPARARLAARPGQRVFRSEVLDGERVEVDGCTITAGARTAFDIARLSDLRTAVTALDRLLSLGIARADDIQRLAVERRRWRGSGRALRALALSRDRVRSPMETLMRLDWLAAGLPAPGCNLQVADERGRLVCQPDLIDLTTGLVAEYDGEYHASAERRSADAVRQQEMTAIGLTVVRMTSADIGTEARRRAWRSRLLAQQEVARRTPRRWVVLG